MPPRKPTKPKKEKPKRGKCYDCRHAYLMQSSPFNPIVAQCDVNKERWVASMEPNCLSFDDRTGEAEIHPMIHLTKYK